MSPGIVANQAKLAGEKRHQRVPHVQIAAQRIGKQQRGFLRSALNDAMMNAAVDIEKSHRIEINRRPSAMSTSTSPHFLLITPDQILFDFSRSSAIESP